MTFKLTTVGLASCSLALLPLRGLALPVDLGTAGPGNWALLEIADAGTAEIDAENVSGAMGGNQGSINGNVGLANISSMTTSAGNFPINGTVYLGSLSSATAATAANATGGVVQNAASQAMTLQAGIDARAASTAAAALSPLGGGVGVSSISAGGSLAPGVYNISSLELPNGAVLTLNGGGVGYYVFNITGDLKLDHAQINLSGITPDQVLFNVLQSGGQGVALTGGLATDSVVHGIILAPDSQISITPGLVVGEIIGGEAINLASGGTINGIPGPPVPDGGSSLLLLTMGAGMLALVRTKLFA